MIDRVPFDLAIKARSILAQRTTEMIEFLENRISAEILDVKKLESKICKKFNEDYEVLCVRLGWTTEILESTQNLLSAN